MASSMVCLRRSGLLGLGRGSATALALACLTACSAPAKPGQAQAQAQDESQSQTTADAAAQSGEPATPAESLRGHIEALTARPEFAWVHAEVLADAVTVRGVAPNAEFAQEFRAQLATVAGVGALHDKIQVARDFNLSFTREGQLMTAAGEVPTLAFQRELETWSRAAFVGTKFQRLHTVAGAPHPRLGELVKLAIEGLHLFDYGVFEIRGRQLVVNGALPARHVERWAALVETIPAPYSLLEASIISAEAMQQCLDAAGIALREHPVRFDAQGALVAGTSLAPIAAALAPCPGAVQLVVHTDNKGSVDERRARTQARADALVRALSPHLERAHGSQVGTPGPLKLKGVGLGAKFPTASNETAAGRRSNNRVEFRAHIVGKG